jgi:hypothetical protein
LAAKPPTYPSQIYNQLIVILNEVKDLKFIVLIMLPDNIEYL